MRFCFDSLDLMKSIVAIIFSLVILFSLTADKNIVILYSSKGITPSETKENNMTKLFNLSMIFVAIGSIVVGVQCINQMNAAMNSINHVGQNKIILSMK